MPRLVPLVPLVAFAVTAATVVACKSSPSPSLTSDAGPTAVVAPAPSAAPELTAEDFVSRVASASCKILSTCKNDEARAYMTNLAIGLAVGDFGHPTKADQMIKLVLEMMHGDHRWMPNEKECPPMFALSLGSTGWNAAMNGKTVSFDPKFATACAKILETPPDLCATEITFPPGGAPDAGPDAKRSNAELFAKLSEYALPCLDAFQGLVPLGGACEYDVECKEDGNDCQATADGGPVSDAAVAPRTCQPAPK